MRGAPQLESGQSAELEQRLADGTVGSLQEHALVSLHPGRAVKEAGMRASSSRSVRPPTEVDARRHPGQAVTPERAIGGVRPEYRRLPGRPAKSRSHHRRADRFPRRHHSTEIANPTSFAAAANLANRVRQHCGTGISTDRDILGSNGRRNTLKEGRRRRSDRSGRDRARRYTCLGWATSIVENSDAKFPAIPGDRNELVECH